MGNIEKFVNESFVDELMKSGVWDIARVKRGSREEESTLNENTKTDADEEEITAAQLAEELLSNLSEDVILEFVNLLHAQVLNEAEEEKMDEAFIPLFNTIHESYNTLAEEYDLSESTMEEIMEAVIDSLDEDDLEDYEAEQIMEALIAYLNEKEDCPSDDDDDDDDDEDKKSKKGKKGKKDDDEGKGKDFLKSLMK